MGGKPAFLTFQFCRVLDDCTLKPRGFLVLPFGGRENLISSPPFGLTRTCAGVY